MLNSNPPHQPSKITPPRASVLELIGNTPLIRAQNLDTGPCSLFLKLESQNPGGSIKDRIALNMIEAAERDGHLKRVAHWLKQPPVIQALLLL